MLLTRLSSLLLLIFATRLVDRAEYGYLTLVVTVGEFTDVAVTSWLRIALLRLGGKGDITRGTLMLAIRVVATTTLIGVLAAAFASRFITPDRWGEFATAVSAYLAVSAFSRLALTILQMQQRHTVYSLLESTRALLQLVLPLAAALLVSRSFIVMSLASSTAILLAGTGAAWAASRALVPGRARFTHRELFALGIPLLAVAAAGFGLNSVERVMLKIYYDAGAVAVFAAAYALARQPIDTIANVINMGGFPEMVSLFDREGPDAAARHLGAQMSLLGRLSFPVVAMIMVLGPEISTLFLPAGYHQSAAILFPLVALNVLAANFTTFVFENVIHAHKKLWLLMWSIGPASLMTITLSILLIPKFAEIGAALALLGGTLTSLGVVIIVSRRLMVVPVPWRDLGTSLGVAVATGLAAWLTSRLLGDVPAFFRLALPGLVGVTVFLGLHTLLHPVATRALATKVKMRLGLA